MTLLVKQIFDLIIQMPYYKNYAAVSGIPHNINNQEQAIADIFIKYGLTEYTEFSSNKKTIKEIIENPKNIIGKKIPSLSFIFQPCGKNDSPDFLVKLHDGVILGIECKTTTKSIMKPMYNSGGIKQKYIYIFSNEKINKTTMYMGRDIITLEQQQLLDELIEKQRELEREYNGKLREADILNRGVSYYTRPMIEQSGLAHKTNYFTHCNREQTEKNVYNYILGLYMVDVGGGW